jgi:iron complex transport system ATP-binding protein
MTTATSKQLAAAIELRALSIGYKTSRKENKIVASNLNATLRAGELVCLLGPNGAGKSTLMRTMAGMQKPLAGAVELGGVNIHDLPARELAKQLSVVLTERISIGAMTAYSLVALGRYPHTNWAGTLSDKDHEVIQWALKTTGASEFANRNIGELSDGERQRVMVARALAQEPQLMILDEITAFLDLPRRVEIMQMLRDLARTTNRAILLSTHDLDLALRSADVIWLLPKGGVMQVGLPEELVLNGAFAKAFAGEGMEFDSHLGAFRIAHSNQRDIVVNGEGEAALWTRRALERQGFRVVTQETPGVDSVNVLPDGAGWQLINPQTKTHCTSLMELLACLKSNS